LITLFIGSVFLITIRQKGDIDGESQASSNYETDDDEIDEVSRVQKHPTHPVLGGNYTHS
jgi:hypothetical protein